MTDRWADWIRTRRSGGDTEYEARMLEKLAVVRDRVLNNAAIAAGETLLDVGCDNGLIGFGALERGAREVIFSDISGALLDDCREQAAAAGLFDRCRFVEAPADDLAEIADESTNVVTTRSVLIYVEDKERALREFHRVLRQHGRISLFEPINRFGMEERRCAWGYALDDATDLMQKVNVIFDKIQPPTRSHGRLRRAGLARARRARGVLSDQTGLPSGDRAAGGEGLGDVHTQLG